MRFETYIPAMQGQIFVCNLAINVTDSCGSRGNSKQRHSERRLMEANFMGVLATDSEFSFKERFEPRYSAT